MVRQHLRLAAQRRKRQYDLRSKPCEFPVGSWVWVFVPRKTTGRYVKLESHYQDRLKSRSSSGLSLSSSRGHPATNRGQST